MNHQGNELLQGVRFGLPVGIGYLPIAVAFGTLALQSGIGAEGTVLMSVLVYAGASQFMAVGMLVSGAGAMQIIIATFFLNLRHLIMSMAVNRSIRTPSLAWKGLLSFGITDETFALLTLQGQRQDQKLSRFFTAGVMSTAYLSWVIGTILGGLGSRAIPSRISEGMAIGLYAMFIGLLTPNVRRFPETGVIALLSMLFCYGFTRFLDQGWSIVLATVLGATAGAIIIGRK
ncbi:MAG: AzlC family ABC transporter permease [Desulfohalobiaceae bacterium]|nr:AzlC family ABC transporter permease [Desulfohalobiaceae bacterium]